MNQEEQIRENVLNIIKDHLQLDNIELSDTLYGVGIDDFDFIEITMLIEKDYDKKLNDDWKFTHDFGSIGAFIDWIVLEVK